LPAKRVCPRLLPGPPDILLRHRLFRSIDANLDLQPLLWIAGPAGAGKTALIASYLAQRKLACRWHPINSKGGDPAPILHPVPLAGKTAVPNNKSALSPFSCIPLPGIAACPPVGIREIFRSISARRPSAAEADNFIIVLDNCDQLPAESLFNEALVNALEKLEAGIRVIMISRTAPPSSLDHLRAQNRLGFITWEELKLTAGESASMAHMKGRAVLDEPALVKLHTLTDGWAAGLILLLEHLPPATAPDLSDTLARNAVFAYFSAEVFANADDIIRHFQMQTAFLPHMTAQMAGQLSGSPEAAQIMRHLHEQHAFLERRPGDAPVYAFHPLYRAFLKLQAQKHYDPEHIKRIRRQAAGILEAFDLKEDAAAIDFQSRGRSKLERLLHEWAPQRIAGGSAKALENWVQSILETEQTHSPILMFWRGTARLADDPAAARRDLKAAFDRAPDTHSIKLLAWAAVVDTYTLAWNDFRPLDTWISWMEDAIAGGLGFPDKMVEARVVTSMSTALMLRQPHHPAITGWIAAALPAAREFANIDFRVQTYFFIAVFYFWRGDLSHFRAIQTEIESLVTLPAASPLSRLSRPCLAAFTDIWLEGSYETARTRIDDALAFANDNGVYTWNHMLLSLQAYCRLSRGQTACAEKSLTALAGLLDGSRKHLYSLYYYLLSWSSYLKGQKAVARVQSSTALSYAETTGYVFAQILCLIQNAWILDETGDARNAAGLLAQAKDLCRKTGSDMLAYAADLVAAGLLLKGGRLAEGLGILTKALASSRENGYLTPPWWCDPPFMSELCVTALEHDIEPAHVAEIICKRRIIVGNLPGGVFQKWPAPVKLYTFGRFEILRWGEPMRFSGKVQKKPLEMLKVLIALGGKNIRKEQVIDILWPDAEGDVAHKSFATTLYRLRQLLGEKQAIQLPEGCICLDPHYCHVDSLYFLEGIAEIGWDRLSSPDAQTLQTAEQLVAIYGGPFLAGDAETSWALVFREKLQRKCLHLLQGLGQYREHRHEWNHAIYYYEKGLEVDSLAEPLYRRLMVCYHHFGWPGEVIRTYQCCHRTLTDNLGIKPSKATETLLAKLFPGQQPRPRV